MTAACVDWVRLYFMSSYRIYGVFLPVLSLSICVPIVFTGYNIVTGRLCACDKGPPATLISGLLINRHHISPNYFFF